jgi:hypothetical protein
MATAKLLKKAMAITELVNTLDNVAADDRIKVEQMPDEQIISEAKYVLSLFYEGGTVQSEMLESDDAEERKDARKQIRQLKALTR